MRLSALVKITALLEEHASDYVVHSITDTGLQGVEIKLEKWDSSCAPTLVFDLQSELIEQLKNLD